MAERLWAALANLKPRTDEASELGQVAGAFVNVVGWAFDRAHFMQLVQKGAEELGLDLAEIEEIINPDDPAYEDSCGGEISALAEELEPGDPARFGTFHTYPVDNDIN